MSLKTDINTFYRKNPIFEVVDDVWDVVAWDVVVWNVVVLTVVVRDVVDVWDVVVELVGFCDPKDGW